ncbi:hypothetical protein HaLaN_00709 [Haematococcus lacustris]|uniref:Uncharacterized protein n=1 Tax=Haematococcus lacustris TaxID=44745 RepID=A0A699Y7H2_HAELA|nr:hypothetical protein HaLaN_00709 [Haematococcus lacustris]
MSQRQTQMKRLRRRQKMSQRQTQMKRLRRRQRQTQMKRLRRRQKMSQMQTQMKRLRRRQMQTQMKRLRRRQKMSLRQTQKKRRRRSQRQKISLGQTRRKKRHRTYKQYHNLDTLPIEVPIHSPGVICSTAAYEPALSGYALGVGFDYRLLYMPLSSHIRWLQDCVGSTWAAGQKWIKVYWSGWLSCQPELGTLRLGQSAAERPPTKGQEATAG